MYRLAENGIYTIVICFTLFFVLVPFISVFIGAFSSGSPGSPGITFTLEKIRTAYLSPIYLSAFANAIFIATIVSIMATGLGVFLAFLTTRTDLPHHSIFEFLAIAPIFVDILTMTIAWIVLGAPNTGFLNVLYQYLTGSKQPLFNIFTIPGIIWVLFLTLTPFAFLIVSPSLKSIDSSFEECSTILGANTFVTLRKIILPLMKPAIFSAALFIFVLSVSAFSVPTLLGAPQGIVVTGYMIFKDIDVSPSDWGMAAATSSVLLWITLVGIYYYRRMTRATSRFVTITSRGYRPRRFKLGRFKYVGLSVCILYSIFSVVLPYLAVVLGSFVKYFTPRLTLELFTVGNYGYIFSFSMFWKTFWNTVILAFLVPFVVVFMGLILSFIVLRTRFKLRGVVDYVSTIPVAVPGLIFGVGLIWAFVATPIYGTIWMLLIALFISNLPYSIRTMEASLLQLDKSLEDSSRVHGASRLETMIRITLPLLMPAVLSTWIMIAVFVVRVLSVVILVYTPQTQMLPIMTWNYMDAGNYPLACTITVVQITIIFLLLLIATRIFRTKLTEMLI